nr:propanediol/glycerol family dehydratase large subunit [Propionibacterium freudenreichii]
MGAAEGKSMLYLEARCLYITKGAGSQGIQNGSVSCIGVPAAVPAASARCWPRPHCHEPRPGMRLVERPDVHPTPICAALRAR